MSVKGVLKKKFKIKSSVFSLKKKKLKQKQLISEPSIDVYHKFDPENANEHSIPDNARNKITLSSKCANDAEINFDKNEIVETISNLKKKRKSTDNFMNHEDKPPQKKKVTFAPDVKKESDHKKIICGTKPISLNKKKKLNYIKKLKAKKIKQKNAKKNEENAIVVNSDRHERAVEYLMQWKNDRLNWKFKKIYQLWLIKNTYDSTKIPKEYFDILVEYFQTIEGHSRNLILQNANAVITNFSFSNEEEEELNSSQQNNYKRARTIIQMFD